MHRTNLYLTAEQERKLDSRALAAGISRSALVRRIIDRELSAPHVLDAESEEALASFATVYHDVVTGLFDDDPDLCIE